MNTLDGTASIQLTTVEYWRERFSKLLPDVLAQHNDLLTLANVLGGKDDVFSGTRGYFRLQNVKQNRASLKVTVKAVQLLEELNPEKKSNPRLSRQKVARA